MQNQHKINTNGFWCFEQVKYVVELARALAHHPAVFRVDLLTRLIDDPKVDKSYAVPEECLVPPGSDGGMGGAYIVRLPCGPRHEYIRWAPRDVCTSGGPLGAFVHQGDPLWHDVHQVAPAMCTSGGHHGT